MIEEEGSVDVLITKLKRKKINKKRKNIPWSN